MKKSLLTGVLITLTLLLIVIPFPYAEQEERDISEIKEIKLILSEPKIISVKSPTRIVINNPNIVDVSSVSRDSVTLVPKANGLTQLIIWDDVGEHPYKIKVLPIDLEAIKRRIDDLLSVSNVPDVYSKIQEEEGKVFLLGSVKMAADKERIRVALGDLTKFTTDLIVLKEEEASVDIDVNVFEISKGAQETMGFLYPTSISLIDVSGPIGTPTTGLPSVFYVSNFTRSAFNFTWSFLEKEGKLRVLSRPRLTCQSGKEADLMVGGQKPTFSTSVTSSGGISTSIEYKDFGVKLKIKPVVTADKRIQINLTVDVTEISGNEVTIGGVNTTALAYPTTVRRATTQVFLNNGQTMAIGGLIAQKKEEDIQRVPWVSKLPLIGTLFRHKDTKTGGGVNTKGDTELFITLTPTIVSPELAVEKKEEKKEEKMEKREKGVSLTEGEPPIKSASSYTKTILPRRPSPQEDIPAPLHNYQVIVQRRIMDKVKYPLQAKASGFQGRVTISLHLSYKGDLLEAKIKESSGYQVLDKSALNAARSVVNYPPFPPSINKDKVWIDVPIDYQLN
ncbi:MAG: TonB family protein [Candidatus Omnitrophica bacterium]|nr:TonB family protein [Candidatus Omnitrophota bacterium]